MAKNKNSPRKRSVSKPKSKQSKYLKTFSSWFENASSTEKRVQEKTLRQGLKDVRRLYSGFDAARGFDARFLKHWPDSRIEELKTHIHVAHRLTSGEFHDLYKLVRPRTAAQARALRLHTGQASLDEQRHPQRSYVIYPNVRDAYVTYEIEDIPVGAAMGRPIFEQRIRVEVREPVKGGVLMHRDYLFREVLGFQPGIESTAPEGLRLGRLLGTREPWLQMVRAMEMLVSRLPATARLGDEAHYRLLTPRGPIGVSVPRHMLVDMMQDWGDRYDPDFVEALIGVRFQGSEFQARKLDVQTNKRRTAYRELARQERKARARITRTGDLHPIVKRKITRKKAVKKTAKRPVKRVIKKALKKPNRSRPTRHK